MISSPWISERLLRKGATSLIDRVTEYVFIDWKDGIETPNSVLIELLKGENFDDLPFTPEEFPKYFRKKW